MADTLVLPPCSDPAHARRRFFSEDASFAGLVGVMLVALAILIFALSQLQRQQHDAAAAVGHTLEVLTSVASLEAQLQTAISEERGYTISRWPPHRDASEAAERQVHESLTELRRLTAGDPSQQAELDRLETLVVSRLETLRRTADAVMSLGPSAIPPPSVLAATRDSVEEVGRGLTDVKAEEQRRLAQREAEAERISLWLWGLLLICGISVTVIAALMVAMVEARGRTRRHVREIEALNAGLEAMVAERTQSLAASEARLRAYFEQSPNGMVVFRRDILGSITVDAVNPAYARIVKRPADMMVGLRVAAVWPEDYAEAMEGCVNTALDTAQPVTLTLHHLLGGEMHLLDVAVAPFREGDERDSGELVLACVCDVTHERALADQVATQARAALEAAEREAAFFAHSPDVMTMIRINEQNGELAFTYEAISPSFEAASGWHAADLIGKSATIWMSPIFAERMLTIYRLCVKTGEPTTWIDSFDMGERQLDGEGIVAPVRDRATGRVTRLIITVRDVTERNRTLALIAQHKR
jgi:PAS domain S-box-containing protein